MYIYINIYKYIYIYIVYTRCPRIKCSGWSQSCSPRCVYPKVRYSYLYVYTHVCIYIYIIYIYVYIYRRTRCSGLSRRDFPRFFPTKNTELIFTHICVCMYICVNIYICVCVVSQEDVFSTWLIPALVLAKWNRRPCR